MNRGRLTVRIVSAISTPGLYGDGNTLFLRVALGGSKQWVQRLTIRGKRHDIGLGCCGWVTLDAARRAALENRRVARQGSDQLAARRQARVPTFHEDARRTHEAPRPRCRSKKVAVNWMQQLEHHAFMRLGAIRVDRIGREDVLAVLTPIWSTKPETAKRVRQHIRATLKWCQAHGFVEFNAAGEAIDGALLRMPAVKAHLRALPYRVVSAALDTVEGSTASLTAKLALRFFILTAARTLEVRGATWDEMDAELRLWRIPGQRMKSGTEHRVPLNMPAFDVLE